MSKRGLLFVVNSLQVGGSETKIVRVANALSAAGLRTGIAYLNGPDTLLSRIEAGVSVTHLGRRGQYSIRALRRVLRLSANGYHTVAAVNLYPLLYVVPAARMLLTRRPLAVGLINTAWNEHLPVSVRRIYAPFLRACDRVVFGCKSEMAAWADGCRLSIERVDHIYNGVDPEFFHGDRYSPAATQLRVDLDLPQDAVVYGSVGRLTSEKNLDVLVAAIGKLNASGRESFLLLAGEGPEKVRLEAQARALGMSDRVRFLGLLRDVRPALAAVDVFVLPSRTETFSNAALEAMAMTKPVVLSRIGGAAEMIVDGEDGRLFAVGNVESLRNVLAQLHDSAETRQRLGEAARVRVLAQFRFSDMVARYHQLAAL